MCPTPAVPRSPTGRATGSEDLLPEAASAAGLLLGRDVPLPAQRRAGCVPTRAPRQQDLRSRIAHWGLSSFPSIPRSFAIVAATGLRKTEKQNIKKSAVKEKHNTSFLSCLCSIRF